MTSSALDWRWRCLLDRFRNPLTRCINDWSGPMPWLFVSPTYGYDWKNPKLLCNLTRLVSSECLPAAYAGYAPIVLERGRKVRERIRDVAAFDGGGPLDPESNYLFGEGGAGTFSDGKLTCRGSGEDVRRILELFAECKGKPSIVYEQRPHLGSNRLPAVVKALRQRIEQYGGEVRFNCRLEDLDSDQGAMRGLSTSSGYLPAKVVALPPRPTPPDSYPTLLPPPFPIVHKALYPR